MFPTPQRDVGDPHPTIRPARALTDPPDPLMLIAKCAIVAILLAQLAYAWLA